MTFGKVIHLIKRNSNHDFHAENQGQSKEVYLLMKEKVLEFLHKEIALDHIPGAVLQVAHRGEVLLREAVGNRTVYPEKNPMQIDTVFDVASLTKVVATLPAVLKLLDDGAIRLDDQVAHFLPEFSQQGKENITLRHVLTHTSGLPAHQPFHKEGLTTNAILERIYRTELVAPVGHSVIYSDLGFIILYQVIEEVTGKSFAAYVHEQIFAPLGMTDTVFRPNFSQDRYAATEYSEQLGDYKRGIVHDENAESMGGISGHAGLFSTIEDVHRFARMIENEGMYQEKQILSPSARRVARFNQTDFLNDSRGIGWMVKSPTHASCGDYFSKNSYGHTGFTGTSLWFDPDIQLHIILLTNRVHFGRHPHMIRLRPRLHNLIRTYF